MSNSLSARHTRATPSLVLSLLLHGALAAGVLVSVAPPARDARAESVEWSIELEPPELPALEERPPAPEPFAPAPVLRAATPRPPAPRIAPREASRVPPVNRRAAPAAAPATTAPALDPPRSAMPRAGATTTPSTHTSTPSTQASSPSASSSSGLYAATDVSERPRLLGHPRLQYPPRALRLGIDADVVLSLIVEPGGNVSSARVLRPAGNGFDEAALLAAQRLRFAPGRIQGTAVAVRVTWTCRFRANG